MKTYTKPDSLKKLDDEIEKLTREKEEAIATQNFEKAANLRDKEKIKRKSWKKSKKNGKILITKKLV